MFNRFTKGNVKVFAARKLCTRGPKFEGGERNFFQTDKPPPPPPPPPPRGFFSRSAKATIFFVVLATVSSFFTAYQIETSDPDLFLPDLETTNKARDASKLQRLTAEEYELRKKQFLETYQGHIDILRFFGITQKKVAMASVWDTSDGNVSGFEEVGFQNFGNESADPYSYGNTDNFANKDNEFETFNDSAFPESTGAGKAW